MDTNLRTSQPSAMNSIQPPAPTESLASVLQDSARLLSEIQERLAQMNQHLIGPTPMGNVQPTEAPSSLLDWAKCVRECIVTVGNQAVAIQSVL